MCDVRGASSLQVETRKIEAFLFLQVPNQAWRSTPGSQSDMGMIRHRNLWPTIAVKKTASCYFVVTQRRRQHQLRKGSKRMCKLRVAAFLSAFVGMGSRSTPCVSLSSLPRFGLRDIPPLNLQWRPPTQPVSSQQLVVRL